MKSEKLLLLAVAIAALHVAGLSIVFGPRHIGYILAATFSATLIWGGVFCVSGQKRRAGVVAGVLLGLAIQQVAYHLWKAELAGFWWSLAQFGALQCLIAYGLGKRAS
jgi:hypothetical protein